MTTQNAYYTLITLKYKIKLKFRSFDTSSTHKNKQKFRLYSTNHIRFSQLLAFKTYYPRQTKEQS